MRRFSLMFLLSLVVVFLPLVASADTNFFGPIVPDGTNGQPNCNCNENGVQGAPDWGCVLQTLQNAIQFAVSIGVVIVTLILAYAGILWITSPLNPNHREQGRSMILSSIIGLVIILSSWLLIDFIMKTLYNQSAIGTGVEAPVGPWHSILSSKDGREVRTCIYPPAPTQSTGQTDQGGGLVVGPSDEPCDPFDPMTCKVGTTCNETTKVCEPNGTGGTPNSPGTPNNPPTTSTSPSNTITAHICTAANNYIGTPTSSGPSNGRLACAWAVNNVLVNAGVSKIGSTNVAGMESALKAGRGSLVAKSSAVCGDIIIEAGQDHVGICLNIGCSRVISNSSSKATFTWESGPDFKPSYSGGVGRIYHVTK